MQAKEECERKTHHTIIQKREAERKEVVKHVSHVPRKAAIVYMIPVPKTDTGGKGENPKAGGRSIVKELGKMTP